MDNATDHSPDATKKVRFKVERVETWYPEYCVPQEMTEAEIVDYIHANAPASVLDEMCNKSTLDTEFYIDVDEML